MADLGIVLAHKLIEVVGSEIVKDVCDVWGYKSQLEDLNRTVCTIKNVLLDAEAKRELSLVARGYIEDLKAAVYDADDLFDEFLTLAELKQLQPVSLSKGGKFSEKVRCFFSSKNQVGQAYRMSRQVKEIKKRLDAIVDDHKKFGFNVDYKPISRRREETCSYVDEKGIIGRDDDKQAIIDTLLDPSIDEDFRFLTIVGVGGLGKTALAQLVYNDEIIRKEFPTFRLWVCVSDQDGEQFDVKAILCKILELVTQRIFDATTTMELVQHLFQEKFSGNKYFLVLDDVWNENRDKWLKLKSFLTLGQRGSRIVVTTRSQMSATIIGDMHTYKLQGLSQENSWRLFEMSAFNEGQEQETHSELVDIGKNIVGKCHNIPLAIKVVGSLLYGQEISKWRSFEESGLAEIRKGQNEIMSILKLSYHNLDSSLKSCFSYCAVFPKDSRIKKETLISLWMAQGYIVPLDGGQSIEDAGEEHFFILLRRCFFQDLEKGSYGRVDSVKIHDLMHDVAQEVGGKELCVVSSIANSLNDKTRHVSFVGEEYSENLSSRAKMRSFFHYNKFLNFSFTQIDKWPCLRVLELHRLGVGSSLGSINNLIHLRYLKLSENKFEFLPNSITKLHNLETLVLAGCMNLRELPKDFSKLVKLRHLDLGYCDKLASMPMGMSKLTSLRMLPFFVVGKSLRNSDEKCCDGELGDLKALTNLNYALHIRIYGIRSNVEGMSDKDGAILKNTRQLLQVEIEFDDTFDGCVDPEAVMENLEPHRNIKGFILTRFKGRVIPRWGGAEDNWAISLPYLVKIELTYCQNLEHIPLPSKLRFLRSLVLLRLDKLEYIEDASQRCVTDGEDLDLFFPSLDYLHISHLESLKGWWGLKGLLVVATDDHLLIRRLRFPRLSTLKILWCFNLTTFPSCPNLENLELRGYTEILGMIVHNNTSGGISSLRSYTVEGGNNLKSLGLEHLNSLECLEISGNDELSITDFGDDSDDMSWMSLQQNLRSLTFRSFHNMRSLPAGMQHLTSLRSLQLYWCNALTALPEWIGYLSSLESMSIKYCEGLKSLPESMKNLTLLQKLEIGSCSYLEERCKEPIGEDWPKIQHVPHVDIIKWR